LTQTGDVLEAPKGTGRGSSNEGLSIRVENDALVVDYKKPEGAKSGICGAHAALNGLTFKRVAKRSSGPTCFKD
jgi:hypothetical protein